MNQLLWNCSVLAVNSDNVELLVKSYLIILNKYLDVGLIK